MSIVLLGFILIIAMILIKYKPTYAVTINNGKKLGYVLDKSKFEDRVNKEVKEYTGKNVENVSLDDNPTYELKLINRAEDTNEDEIIVALQEDATITYKYYEVSLDDKKVAVNTEEEANKLVNDVKQENAKTDLDLEVNKVTTQDIEKVKTDTVDVAKNSLETELNEKLQQTENAENKAQTQTSIPKSTPAQTISGAEVNGVKLAVKPVSGTITSRFGVSSRIRSSTHTGLDIGCSSGTAIKAVASGTVTNASYSGAYGNLVKIKHGNGVETWYGHCSKIYVKVGQTVQAGDTIAAVGSTGNSTGPHLHLEIRINGSPVNPQKYMYK